MEYPPARFDLEFNPPLMNAAGSLGFAPDPHGVVELSRLGAFVTNPISLGRRAPARNTRYLAYPGGFLLHTGYPNPGLKAVIRRYSEQWRHAPLPIILHLLCQDPAEIQPMLQLVEDIPGVAGLELSFPPPVAPTAIIKVLKTQPVELPLILRARLEDACEMARELVKTEFPLAAVCLGAPRGALLLPSSAAGQETARGSLVKGRLYGPALFPQALETILAIRQIGAPVIGAGGVYHPQQAEAMLSAGALAVQIDAVFWRGGFA